jgi:endoribonuclease LACTB2
VRKHESPLQQPDLSAHPSHYELLLAHLKATATEPSAPKARGSAAVIPWRRAQATGALEIYWVRRADSLKFMGGWHAFPGGGLSRDDAAVAALVDGHPVGMDVAPPVLEVPDRYRAEYSEFGPDDVPGIAVCALRELFEETGLLPTTTPPSAAAVDWLAAERVKLLGGTSAFGPIVRGLLELHGLTVTAAGLVFGGRWLTPPFMPMRFDNRFFLLEVPADAALQPSIIEGELTEGAWLSPTEAFARWERGDVLAAPPILHILKVLAESGLPQQSDTARERLLRPVEADIGPLRRIEFRPGIVLLPMATPTLPPATHTNAFLVGSHEMALVDPGSPFPGEIERMKMALTAMQEQVGRKIVAIWLTHHHGDHVGAVNALRAFLDVPVFAHRLTAEKLADVGIAVDQLIEDGDRLTLKGSPDDPKAGPDRTFIAVHTPGHAPGHLCFFEPVDRSMIAGDMVAGLSTIVIDPPDGDMDQYIASLEKLAALEPLALFPAHGPVFKDGAATLRQYVQHRAWREEKIVAAWKDGLHSTEALLPVVYSDSDPKVYPIAARQLLAHLVRLQRQGRVGPLDA